jgi:hypothetical protein
LRGAQLSGAPQDRLRDRFEPKVSARKQRLECFRHDLIAASQWTDQRHNDCQLAADDR